MLLMQIASIRESFDRCEGGTALQEHRPTEAHSVSGALKLWFKLLPEPVFSFGLYNKWMIAQRKCFLLCE